MKSIFKKRLILLFLTIFLTLFVVACKQPSQSPNDGSDDRPGPVVEDDSIKLSHAELELVLGESTTITVEVNSDGETLEWEVVGGDSVITFDEDSKLIKAVGIGSATIKVQSGFSYAECKVTVVQKLKEHYSLSLDRTLTRVTVGQKLTLNATLKLGSEIISDAAVEWSVVEGDAVTVTDKGLVTAEREGSAIVRAICTIDENTILMAECEVEVSEQLACYKVYPDGDDASDRLVLKNEIFRINPQVFDAEGNLVNVSLDELTISSETPDVMEYLGNGRFCAIKSGLGEIRVEYEGVDGYCDFTVWEFNAVEMLENVGDSGGGSYWGGSVTVRPDGKLQYTAPAWASAVAFKSSALEEIKNIASTYGYSKLVLTLYSTVGDVRNMFVEGNFSVASNVAEKYNGIKETDIPVRYSIDFDTFKDWSQMQVLMSLHMATDVTFTLTLEKYEVSAESKLMGVGETLGFDDLNVSVIGELGALEGLSHEDFTVTNLNPDVVTYKDGVFSPKAEGRAVICVAYSGVPTYVTIDVLGDVYTIPFEMYSVGEHTFGSYRDEGNGVVYMIQQNWMGLYTLEIAGENWANLKALANQYGYTKIVLTVHSIIGSFTWDNTVANGLRLNGSGEYPIRHENSLANYADASSLVVLQANTYWEHSGEQSITFSITLEKSEDVEENDKTTYNLTADMMTGNDWFGASLETRADGKFIYHGTTTGFGAIILTDAALASVKEMAATQGYTKLVVTLYSANQPNIISIFANDKYNTTFNVGGAHGVFTEADDPQRYEIACADFQDWEAMQVICSAYAVMDAVFTLTLEK